jgi:hypothetical protein
VDVPVQRDRGLTGHDEPVLGPTAVPLVTEAPTGVDHDPLHLVVAALVQDGVLAPWASFVRCAHRSMIAEVAGA